MEEFRVEPVDLALEHKLRMDEARRGVVSLEKLMSSCASLELGDSLPGYGFVENGEIFSYDDFRTDEEEWIEPEKRWSHSPPKNLGPKSPQIRTKPGVREY